ALHLVAALHLELRGVAVDRYEAIFVTDEHRVAKALQAVTGIDHDAILGCTDGGALRYRDIDAVVRLSAAAAELGNDASLNRPAQATDTSCLRRKGCHFGTLLSHVADRR